MFGTAGHTDAADSRTFGFPKSQTFSQLEQLDQTPDPTLERRRVNEVAIPRRQEERLGKGSPVRGTEEMYRIAAEKEYGYPRESRIV